jgi:predicted amidohydrolase
MAGVKLAAVQAAYTLMNQEACVDKAVKLLHQAAAEGAGIVVFPEVFIPGNPIWIDTVPIWDGDGDWYALLVEQAVVVPGPVTDTLEAAARETGTYLVIGADERELHGTTIYNATLYFGPDGTLLGKHRRLMPTGSERTVWGMGDGSTLPVIDTPYGRLFRADLLGELHAADPVLCLQPGSGYLDCAHPRPRGRLDRHDAAHRP